MTRWTIGRRIGLGFGVLLTFLLALGFYGQSTIAGLAHLAGVSKRSVEGNLFMIERQVDHLEWVRGVELQLLEVQEFKGQLDDRKCKFGEWLFNPQTRGAVDDAEVNRLLASIEQPHAELHRSARVILDAMQRHDVAAARQTFVAQTLPALKSTTGILRELRARYDAIRTEQGGKAADDLERSARSGRWLLLGGAAVAFVVALVLAYAIRRNIHRLLDRMVRELSAGAEQVSSAASQVAAASQGLSQGATEQAASLEQTSASMEEMASMTRRSAESAEAAAGLVTEADRLVQGASAALGDMVSSMGSIMESSTKVSNIIKTIDEIAFQTNILALNAAVEAARAGDAGMGFAVVADEVRNLAQRSAQAAKDTAVLIQESAANAEAGSARVTQAATWINGITESVHKVKGLVQEVSTASHQQAQGIAQVTQAIAEMEKVTQTTAATAEESAATSEELSSQCEVTRRVVTDMQSFVGGTAPVERRVTTAKRDAKPVAAFRRARSEPPSADLPATGTYGAF